MSFTDDMGLEYIEEGSKNAHEAFNDDMDIVNNGRDYKFELGDGGNARQVFYYDFGSGTAKLAIADSVTTSHVVGILTQDGAITDERRFRYIGKLEISGWSLTPYSRYYLSPTVAGGITTVRPSGLDKIVEVGFTGVSTDILYIQIREYLENVGQSIYASIAGSTFQPYLQSSTYTRGASKMVLGAVNPQNWFANIQIPNGAVAMGAEVFGLDQSASDITWALTQVTLSTGATSTMATEALNTEDTTITNEVVDNSLYAYVFSVGTCAELDEIWGARITYVISS